MSYWTLGQVCGSSFTVNLTPPQFGEGVRGFSSGDTGTACRPRGIRELKAVLISTFNTSETPEGFALLFFAPTSRPRTRTAWRRAPPGLPDPLAHLVCKFWLGEPPRRRRRSE